LCICRSKGCWPCCFCASCWRIGGEIGLQWHQIGFAGRLCQQQVLSTGGQKPAALVASLSLTHIHTSFFAHREQSFAPCRADSTSQRCIVYNRPGCTKPECRAFAKLHRSMMQVYIESILALQNKASAERGEPVKLEMVIMTSDDTHSRTQALLDDHSYFGMQRKQLHLLKQEKVCGQSLSHTHLLHMQSLAYGMQSFCCMAGAAMSLSIADQWNVCMQLHLSACLVNGASLTVVSLLPGSLPHRQCCSPGIGKR